MTEQERINAELHERLAVQDAKFNQFLDEMREQNRMRAEENAEIRKEIREINKATDEKIAEIKTYTDSMNKHIRNLSYTSIAAIAAMVVTVLFNLTK